MKTKSIFLIPMSLLALTLSGCNLVESSSISDTGIANPTSETQTSATTLTSTSSPTNITSYSTDPYIPSSSSTSEPEIPVDQGDFSLLNADKEAAGFEVSGSTYTINTAGSYTLTGTLNGNIVVTVTKNDKVELNLEGVTINSSEYAPIFITKADEVKIKAKKNTTNVINDNRPNKTVDSDDQGEGAIAAKADLDFVGAGTLYVYGNYNNGIHTSKDIKIKNIQLRSWAYQHAIRGGNSITIFNEKTYVEAIAKTGDGLKSNDAGVSSSKQKGNITITGGTVKINAADDGIDAAYNVEIHAGLADEDDENSGLVAPSIEIYTEKYASLSKAPGGGGWGPGETGNTNKSSDTAKGIKASNEINISEGKIYIKAYDDGLHANSEPLTDSDDVETGVTGAGNINVSGGTITVECTDDGMHADKTLTITGEAVVNVLSSYEGLEGSNIIISGGHTKVFGTDDGINAAGDDNPTITVSGGYLEVEVSPNGDTDGIDSNGTYTQTGGVVITKGPNSNNSSALDHEGTASLQGGTIIVLGSIEGSTRWGGGGGPGGGPGGSSNVTIGSNMSSYTLSLHSSGSHSITVNGVTYEFTNSTSYSKTTCYSDSPVTGS